MERESKTGGTTDEMVGKGKKAIGDVTDNPEMELEGRRQEERGELKKDVADKQERRERI